MRPIRSWKNCSPRGRLNLHIDTHILIWSLTDPKRLAAAYRAALVAPENEVWVSTVSIWEIVIKALRGKIHVPENWVSGIAAQNFQLMAFEARHALAVRDLPLRHQDPFDRALLAQARMERFQFMTADNTLNTYHADVQFFGR